MFKLRDIVPKPSWIVETARLIKKGELTLTQAANSVEIDTILGEATISMHPKTLSKLFKQNGYTFFLPGRKGFSIEPTEEEIEIVTAKKAELQCGINKLWEHINKEGFQISRLKVERICQSILLTPKKPKKKEKIRSRYLVNQVNGAWHGDIHYIILNQEQKYLFTLIDDRSRFIVGWGLGEHKNSELVLNTFQKAVEQYTTPLAFWSDNGKENIAGLIDSFLKQNDIHHCLTIPGNPQSNGKIEVWWKPLEKRLETAESWPEIESRIENYIRIYNYSLPHLGLEKINGFHAYPAEVFFDENLQKTNLDECTIHIDNKGDVTLANFWHIKKIPSLLNIQSLLN